MKTTIQSKRTFSSSSAVNAEKACKRDNKVFVCAHELPSSRFCYIFEITI